MALPIGRRPVSMTTPALSYHNNALLQIQKQYNNSAFVQGVRHTNMEPEMEQVVSISSVKNSPGEIEVYYDDSVPTDLTVSISGPVQEVNHDRSDAVSFENEAGNAEIVKRLRSEIKFLKLELQKKNVPLEKLLAETRQEVELLKQHVHFSNSKVKALEKENALLSDKFLEIQIINLRLKSEKVIVEEEVANVKNAANELETKWVSLTESHGQVIERINKGGFSFDEFERLQEEKTILNTQCRSLTKENHLAHRAVKKWRNKFNKLKNEYEKRLEEEMGQLRQSVQMQIQALRLSGTEHLEERLLEMEQGKGKALREAVQLRKQNDELQTKISDLELRAEKLCFRLEQTEATKAEVSQRFVSATAARSRLQRERDEIQRQMQTADDDFKTKLMAVERRVGELQFTAENQAKQLRDYEEAFLAIHTGDGELVNGPLLLKIHSENALRMTKRVTQLETEKRILSSQQRQLTNTIQHLQAEVESNQRFVSQLKEKAPETVGLFRDKEAQLRELRSQLNRKDVQLLSYAHKVEALKRNNKQLTADLKQIMEDRAELEVVKRLLIQDQTT